MTLSRTIITVAVSAVFSLAQAASKPVVSGPLPAADTSKTVAKMPPSFRSAPFDSALTDQARIYAGMDPLDPKRYQRLTSSNGWKVHRTLFEENWLKLDKRLLAMNTWRVAELAGISQAGATLFYPFSGPDFLNGDLFFPDCETSIYLSLEKTGDIPKADMSEAVFVNFIEDIRTSLSNIFIRNYFVTKRMNEQLHTPYLKGNLALFLVFLARRDCAIVSVQKIHIDSGGKAVNRPRDTGAPGKNQTSGMAIRYIKAGTNGKIRSLYYFPVDIADESLRKKPWFRTWLQSHKNLIMFTKAASYCLHCPDFSLIRGICLTSRAILEDDSGIPYRFLPPDAWTVTLYGNYTKPVSDFNYGFQKDLQKAFTAKQNVKPLTFNIGYHWRDDYSNLILAVRK